MELEQLVRAVAKGDLITAREWVADAQRSRLQWASVPRPTSLGERDLAIAAGLAELLAERGGTTGPSWACSISGPDEPFILDPGLDEMPRSLERARTFGPEPLRKRNLVALPDFLRIA